MLVLPYVCMFAVLWYNILMWCTFFQQHTTIQREYGVNGFEIYLLAQHFILFLFVCCHVCVSYSHWSTFKLCYTHTQSSARALAFDSYIFIGCSQNSLGVWQFELITIWHTHPHQMSKESYLRMSKFTFIHFLCVGRRHWNSTIIAMISRILRKNKTNITELQCFQSNLFY